MALSYRIARNSVLGRHLVASRDIRQGEVIMREHPLVIGGQQTSILICFKCAQPIRKSLARPCEKCRIVPVCGMCASNLHEAECKYFATHTDSMQNCTFSFLCEHPSVVMPLRCLLLKHMNRDAWEEMMQLESHLNERRGKDVYDWISQNVEEPLRTRQLFDDLTSSEGDDLVQKVCGILDVNSFELRYAENTFRRGLYLKPALMSHDCICNTFLSIDDEYVMTVKASLDIRKDEVISFNYTNVLAATSARQLHLQEGKYFTCTCRRCLDPTELGTGLSSLICPACKCSQLVCVKGGWRCMQCKKEFNQYMIHTTLELARDKVQEVIRSPHVQDMKMVIDLLLRTLHKNHAFLLEVYLSYVSLRDYEHDMEYLEEKLAICEQLSGVLHIIEPGISRHQGIVLYELYRTKLRLGQMDALEVLKEAIKHLQHEPTASPEGRLAQEAFNDAQSV